MPNITRTLVAIDFSPASLAALDFAQVLAHADVAPAIHAVHAFALPMVPLPTGDVLLAADFDLRARQEIERALREVVAAHRDPSLPIEAIVLDGPAGSAIVEHAARLGCARIVVGATGRGVLPRLLIGSIAERIVRTSTLDVVVVPLARPGAPPNAIRRIVCATDFSAPSEVALLRAIEFARAHAAPVDIVHAWEPAPYTNRVAGLMASVEHELERALDETLVRHRSPTLQISAAIRHGRAAETIVAFAVERGSDLIVTGTTGKTGLDHLLLGSVAERVVRLSPVPVLVARPRASTVRA